MGDLRLRWKKESPPTGLARIGAGPRSSDLRDPAGTRYATVSALRAGGWYWVASWRSGIPHQNTCGEPAATEAEAKKQAVAYVRTALAALDAGGA